MRPLNIIAQAVCRHYDTDTNILSKRSRRFANCLVRHVFVYFAWQEGYTHTAIGRYLNRHHTTCIHAIHRVENDIRHVAPTVHDVAKIRETIQAIPDPVTVMPEATAPIARIGYVWL